MSHNRNTIAILSKVAVEVHCHAGNLGTEMNPFSFLSKPNLSVQLSAAP